MQLFLAYLKLTKIMPGSPAFNFLQIMRFPWDRIQYNCNKARTSSSAWLDVKKNRNFDSGIEVRERLGIVSVAEHGAGKVVVIADDAVLLDMFISETDNRLFGENIIEWFNRNTGNIS